MTEATPQEDDLVVPDRFEALSEAGSGSLRSIVVPVDDALNDLDDRFTDMRSARRGTLMVLRGESGSGKSTFLDTVGLFRKGVVTEHIASTSEIPQALTEVSNSDQPRVLVLDGREALGEVSRRSIESSMHAINSFVRSEPGRNTLVVWPTNTDDLTNLLEDFAKTLGGDALVGLSGTTARFQGPDKSQFHGIAERTIAALNRGASLVALGISEARAIEIAEDASTIGRYLGLIRRDLLQNQRRVKALMPAEQPKLWVIVISGNEPEGDVAALTRGGYAFADMDRLMTATGANVVRELKKYPDKLGILATVLDARILFIEMQTVLSVARQYGDDQLHSLMRESGMATSADKTAEARISDSELGTLLTGSSLGTRKPGGKSGSNTKTSFLKLAAIAQKNDGLINKAIGKALKEVGLVDTFEIERDLGTDLNFISDIYVMQNGKPIRLEVMWRSRTSRAEIANYVLGKLNKYGKAIGLLD